MSGLLLIAAALAATPDAGVTASLRLAPPEIPYHRQAELTLTVEAPEGADVKLPDIDVESVGLTVANLPTPETEALKNGRRRVRITYVLDAIWAGDYALPPVILTWSGDQSLTIPAPALRVRDLTDEEREAAEQFAPIAPPPPVPTPIQEYAPQLAVLALILAALAAVLAYLLFWRHREAPPAPPAPAWEVAYQRLRELDQRQLPQQGQFEPFYVILSDILRHYIEDRFAIHAPEETTPEFLDEASRSGLLTDGQQRMLGAFLRHCDRVKFARYEPAFEEMERSFSHVLRFVDETIPKPEPQREEAAA